MKDQQVKNYSKQILQFLKINHKNGNYITLSIAQIKEKYTLLSLIPFLTKIVIKE